MYKTALLSGITGQDGGHLTELLLDSGFMVHGIIRRSSNPNTSRIDHLYKDPHESKNLFLHYGDLSDSSSIHDIVMKVQPDLVFHLGAMSHVKVSFDIPEYTADVTGIGTLRMLEAIRKLSRTKRVRFYNAASSEMFGNATPPQNESTPFDPRSPYAAAKVYSFNMTKNFRESYGLFACNGICFNHEGPKRGINFVSRKITMAVARISKGQQDRIYLGNLNAKRDWGYAGDYVKAMHLMLQADSPDDYIIATGEAHTVREFTELAFAKVGIDIKWTGTHLRCGVDKEGKCLVEVDPKYFRPSDVDCLLGDATKIKQKLGWEPKVKFHELVGMMVDHDLRSIS